jgi:hypothetical protein
MYYSLPPQPIGTAVLKQLSQPPWLILKFVKQHAPHTLQPARYCLHATVPFSWPQLCGVMHLQVAMQLPGVCEPARFGAHLPVDESQLQHVGGGSVQQSLMAFDTPQASNVTVPPSL